MISNKGQPRKKRRMTKNLTNTHLIGTEADVTKEDEENIDDVKQREIE